MLDSYIPSSWHIHQSADHFCPLTRPALVPCLCVSVCVCVCVCVSELLWTIHSTAWPPTSDGGQRANGATADAPRPWHAPSKFLRWPTAFCQDLIKTNCGKMEAKVQISPLGVFYMPSPLRFNQRGENNCQQEKWQSKPKPGCAGIWCSAEKQHNEVQITRCQNFPRNCGRGICIMRVGNSQSRPILTRRSVCFNIVAFCLPDFFFFLPSFP